MGFDESSGIRHLRWRVGATDECPFEQQVVQFRLSHSLIPDEDNVETLQRYGTTVDAARPLPPRHLHLPP